jgi:WD40-like Beta Propeller Repeat
VIVLTSVLVLSLLPWSLQATHADAKALTFAEPAKTAALDSIKGQPTHIAWSPDGSQVFVQTGDRTRIGTYQNPHYYMVSVRDGKVAPIDAAPAWVAEYSAWKANKWAPGNRSIAIDIDDQRRTQRATSAPVGGDLAKGGGGTGQGSTADDAVNAALDSQVQHVITLRLNGEVVGEYVDQQFVPGYTFSWAPESFGTMIAYTTQGRLSVMDRQGGKKEVENVKNALLPAWSSDGSRIAFLRKDGKKYALYVTTIR